MLRTTLGLRLIVSLLALVVLLALSLPLATLLLGSSDAWLLMALIGPIVFFDTINLVPLSFLRAERRPRAYALISFSRAVLGSLLIITFVVVLDLGVTGVILGSACSALVTSIAGIRCLPAKDDSGSGSTAGWLVTCSPSACRSSLPPWRAGRSTSRTAT